MTTFGPVEYVVISFPRNDLCGKIAPALADLVASDTIRILDLVLVSKSADGGVSTLEFDELVDTPQFGDIDGDVGGVVSAEDVLLVAEGLEPDASALLILWEDRWALPLAQAVRAAGGVIVEGERIPAEVIEAMFVGVAADG